MILSRFPLKTNTNEFDPSQTFVYVEIQKLFYQKGFFNVRVGRFQTKKLGISLGSARIYVVILCLSFGHVGTFSL